MFVFPVTLALSLMIAEPLPGLPLLEPATPRPEWPGRDPAPPDGLPADDGPWRDRVFTARSKDGLKWEVGADAVASNAGAPEIIELSRATPSRNGPDAGTLLLYAVDYASYRRQGDERLTRRTSGDAGKSWAAAQEVTIAGLPEGVLAPVEPSVVQLDDGRLRLYFRVIEREKREPPRDREEARARGQSRLYSAVSNDGLRFTVEDDPRLELPKIGDPEVLVLSSRGAQEGDRKIGPWLMFLTRGTDTLLATSDAGRTWTRDETFLLSAGKAPGAMEIPDKPGLLRVFVGAGDGVRSATFEPATGELTDEQGLRVDDRADNPAVTRLLDGTFLMVFTRREREDTRPRILPPIVPPKRY